MAYDIVLEVFEGPLDLLLHLIQKQELNIHDVPIATITEQYMDYLQAMEELSLDVASEFIVMAATLLAIKSRMLLPRPPKTQDDEVEIDPREELIRQLLEYQQCKAAAEQLRHMELLQSHVFSRPPMNLSEYAENEPPPIQGVSLWDLVDAFRKLKLRLPSVPRVAEIRGHVVGVDEMMLSIMSKLEKWERATFTDLVDSRFSRAAVVSAFLALLELVKSRKVTCTQGFSNGDIEICLYREVGTC